jgi:hypothetical protein
MEALKRFFLLAGSLLLLSCSHATPQVVQIFDQVDRVFDPDAKAWSERLSVFVQAASGDGNKVFDRLHVIHDGQGLYFTLGRGQWTAVDRPGEYWVGAKDLSFPDGKIPTGEWRALLVTRSGQKVEVKFQIPPPALGVPPARNTSVAVQADPTAPGRYRVSGWVDDYLVWASDLKGTLLIRTKTVGPTFQVPSGTTSFVLYSYDKERGEGLEAGPFPVQDKG